MALSGFHMQKITSATDNQPTPASPSWFHTPPAMVIIYTIPPMPDMPPPTRVAMYLFRVTLMPAASAVAGFSPTARR